LTEADNFIEEVDREEAEGDSHDVLSYRYFDDSQVTIEVHELNHNVSVWMNKSSKFTPKAPGTNVRLVLLHPYDTALSKELVIDSSHLNTRPSWGFPNFMTSTELDEYTVNGKYYIAFKERVKYLAARAADAVLLLEDEESEDEESEDEESEDEESEDDE
jgi:hypothetical protein